MKFIRENYPYLGALILVTAVVYGFNLSNVLFWDDTDWIVNNPYVHGLGWSNIKAWFSENVLGGIGGQSNYYRPFLLFTFALNYLVSGANPLTYHLVNNGLHILNALLVFLLFSKVLKSRRIGFVTALLFALHPLATEAVTYISGRGDPLYVFFTLAGLWLFYQAEKLRQGWLGWRKPLSLVALGMGLLSREVMIVFPLLALIFSAAWLETTPFWRSLINSFKKTWPYFLLVLVYGILRLTVLNFSNTLNFYAQPNVYSENLHVRLFTFAHALWNYFGILVAPLKLHMERSIPVQLSPFDWPVWLVIVLLVGALYGLFRLYQKQSGSFAFRLWAFAFAWWFITLGPVSGITPINAQIYEHWLYLPALAVFVLFAYYFDQLLNFLSTRQAWLYRGAIGLLVVYLSWFSWQSIQRNILWGKPIEFYQDILRYEPDSVRINNNLGNKYYDAGNIERAEFYYRQAVASEDIFPQPHFNLGTILQSRGDIEGAIAEYNKAIELNPHFYYPYQNLASLYAKQGDLVAARQVLERLLAVRPDDPMVYYNLAAVHWVQGNYTQAKAYAERGLNYAPVGTLPRQALEDILIKLANQL